MLIYKVKTMLFEKARKMQSLSLLLSKCSRKVIHWLLGFLQSLKRWKKLNWRSDTLKTFQFSMWRVVINLVQNLGLCKNFISNSDTFSKISFKIWQAVLLTSKLETCNFGNFFWQDEIIKLQIKPFKKQKICKNFSILQSRTKQIVIFLATEFSAKSGTV